LMVYAITFAMQVAISFPIIVIEQGWAVMTVYIINFVVFAISILISGKELLANKA